MGLNHIPICLETRFAYDAHKPRCRPGNVLTSARIFAVTSTTLLCLTALTVSGTPGRWDYAWPAIAAVWGLVTTLWLTRSLRAPDAAPLHPSVPALGLTAGLTGLAGWQLARIHAVLPVPVVGVSAMPARAESYLAFLPRDPGLPSLVHRHLNLLAGHVGGMALITAVHLAIYALIVWMLVDLASRLAGRWAALALTVGWATAPTIYQVFADIRAYPTFLLFVLWAERAMVTRDGGLPNDRGVLRRLGLAVLEIPSALGTIGAYLAARWLTGRTPAALWWAGACVLLGGVPLSMRARAFHEASHRATLGPVWASATTLLLLLMALLLADAFAARWQRAAVAASAGSMALIVALIATAGLDPEPRYIYQSCLLAVALATGQAARRLGWHTDPEAASLRAGAVVLALLGLVHAPGPGEPLVNPALLGLALGAAVAAAAATRLPRLAQAGLITAALSLVARHEALLQDWLAPYAQMHPVVVAALAVSAREDLPVCARIPGTEAYARATATTAHVPAYTAPLYLDPQGEHLALRRTDPRCDTDALWLVTPREAATGCHDTTLAATPALRVVRCDAPPNEPIQPPERP